MMTSIRACSFVLALATAILVLLMGPGSSSVGAQYIPATGLGISGIFTSFGDYTASATCTEDGATLDFQASGTMRPAWGRAPSLSPDRLFSGLWASLVSCNLLKSW